MLVLAGLPEPRCNVSVGDEERRIAEVDLLYDSYRLVIEYEGEQHRTDGWQWSVDIERAEALAAAGYTLIRVTAARMLNPRALPATIFDHLRAPRLPRPEAHLHSRLARTLRRLHRVVTSGRKTAITAP